MRGDAGIPTGVQSNQKRLDKLTPTQALPRELTSPQGEYGLPTPFPTHHSPFLPRRRVRRSQRPCFKVSVLGLERWLSA